MAPMAPVVSPFCLDAFPAEDLAVLVTKSASSNAGKGAPEWLRKALRSSGFVCMSRTPERKLVVVIGESFLKEVQLPADVEVERQWAALRLDKATLSSGDALHAFSSLCKTVQEAGLVLHAVSTPDSEHLLLQTQYLPVMTAALLGVGHAITPATRVCTPLPPGIVSKGSHCKAYMGAWGLARREMPAGVLAEEHSHGRGPLRLIASCGLFVELRMPAADASPSSQASYCGYLETIAPGQVRRHRFVDFQPPSGSALTAELDAQGAVLTEAGIPSGCYRETWQRLEPSGPVVALELVSESPIHGPVKRQGCWIFCGGLFARVVGLPKGEGLVAGTCCGSLEQLQRLKGEDAIRMEVEQHYEAISGTLEKPGVLRITQQAWAPNRAGTLYYSGDEGQGGTIVTPSRKSAEVIHVLPDGTEQRWRVLEWGFNPFSERAVSPAASDHSAASGSSSARAKKKKKKEKARSASKSGSGSDSAARKKKKKKDKDKKKKKKDKDRAQSSDDAKDQRKRSASPDDDKKKKKDKDKEKGKDKSKDKKDKKSASRSRSRSKNKKDKKKKDRSASGSSDHKKKRSPSRSDKKKKKREASGSRSRSAKRKDKKDKKDKQDEISPQRGIPQAQPEVAEEVLHDMDAEPRQGKITINFATKLFSGQRETPESAAAQQMLRKAEVQASQLAAVGALLARASATKAPQADPAPAFPPQLLAAPPANSPADRFPADGKAAGATAPSDDEGSDMDKDEPATEASAKSEINEGADEKMESAPKEVAADPPAEIPPGVHPLYPKGYPPPKEDEIPPGVHPLYPKGYPPPPEEPGMHPLFPTGYPPPPDAIQAMAAPLMPPPYNTFPPPPPSDPNSAPISLPPSMLLPPPPHPNTPQLTIDPVTGAYIMAPPPSAPAQIAGPSASDAVNNFLKENRIDSRAAGAMRTLPMDIQLKVVTEGPVTGTNTSAVLTARIRKIESLTPKAGSAPPTAVLPPGGIGPQPPPGEAPLHLGAPPPGAPPGMPPPGMPPLGAPPLGAAPFGLQLGMPPPPGYGFPGMPPLGTLGFGFPGMLPPPGAQGGFLLPPPGPPPGILAP